MRQNTPPKTPPPFGGCGGVPKQHEQQPQQPSETRHLVCPRRWANLLNNARHLTGPALDRIANTAKAMEARHAAKAFQHMQEEHSIWIGEQHRKGLAGLFRWLRPKRSKAPLTHTYPDGTVTDHVPTAMQAVAGPWLKAWAPGQLQAPAPAEQAEAQELEQEYQDVLSALRAARQEQGNQWEPPTTDQIDAAAKKQKPHTGMGVEQLRPADILALPHLGKLECCNLIHVAEGAWMWPWQCMPSIVH